MIQALFHDKIVFDDRVPITTFYNRRDGYEVDLLLPKLDFSIQLLVILLLQMFISSVLAIVAYYGIIKRPNTNASFLLGYGIILPVTLGIPFLINNYLDIRNCAFRMGLTPISVLTSLRCLEALYGYNPPYTSVSLWNYIVYWGSLLELQWDEQNSIPIRSTWRSKASSATHYGSCMLVLTLLFSWLVPVRFEPLEDHFDATTFHVTFEPAQLFNNFIAAVLMSITLSFSMHGISLLSQLVFGYQTKAVVHNPMFYSSSPSDFWGRRWNCLVHACLKRGVYKPVRNVSSSKLLAALSTFIMSGLMHEYVWLLLFSPNVHEREEWLNMGKDVLPFGKQVVFFGWNGILVMLEYIVVGSSVATQFTWVPKTVPTPIVGILVVLVALPVAHWYTGDMIAFGCFSHMQQGFPLIIVNRK